MKKTLLSFIIIVSFASCSKKEVDVRDQYVGKWDFELTGGFNTYYNGQIAESIPLTIDGTTDISKSGERGLLINETEYILEGDELTCDPEDTQLTTPAQASVILTETLTSGKARSTKITLKSTLEGTWTIGNQRGPAAGDLTLILTKI